MPMQTAQAFPASSCARIAASSNEARDVLARRHVNTSLRGTLFFLITLLYCE